MKFSILIALLTISFLSYKEKNTQNGNFGFYTVMTNSMEPSIPKGAAVVTRVVEEFEIGDIVTFRYPLNMSQTITHRIVGIDEDESTSFISKGDSNHTADPWQLKSDLIQGKVVLTVPLLGYVIGFIRTSIGLLLLVVLPLGIAIIFEADNIYSEAKSISKLIKEKNAAKIVKAKRIALKVVDNLKGLGPA